MFQSELNIKIILLSVLLSTVASKVVEIDEENWSQMLDGEWMVEL